MWHTYYITNYIRLVRERLGAGNIRLEQIAVLSRVFRFLFQIEVPYLAGILQVWPDQSSVESECQLICVSIETSVQ